MFQRRLWELSPVAINSSFVNALQDQGHNEKRVGYFGTILVLHYYDEDQ